jgi:hypothetical protein
MRKINYIARAFELIIVVVIVGKYWISIYHKAAPFPRKWFDARNFSVFIIFIKRHIFDIKLSIDKLKLCQSSISHPSLIEAAVYVNIIESEENSIWINFIHSTPTSQYLALSMYTHSHYVLKWSRFNQILNQHRYFDNISSKALSFSLSPVSPYPPKIL